MAAAGSKGVVQILARSGQVVDSIVVADAARTAVVFVATVAKLEVSTAAFCQAYTDHSSKWPGQTSGAASAYHTSTGALLAV